MAKKDDALILDEAEQAPEVQEAPEVEETSEVVEAPKKKASAGKVKPKYDAINVYNNKSFVRQYSKAIHGEKFAELAEGFAKSRGFGVEAVVTENMTSCPACGHKFKS